MGVAKYFVWGEGIWRELDVASGRVTGWRRRARFVFLRRGRLQVARRRGVLRALQALSAGQPSDAADGPRLSYRRKSDQTKKLRPSETRQTTAGTTACENHHCCAHLNGFNQNILRDVPWPIASATPIIQQQKIEASTQYAHKVDAGTSPDRSQTITIKPKVVPNDSSGEDFIATPKTRKLNPKIGSNRTAEVNALLGTQKSAKSEKSPVVVVNKVPSKACDESRASRRRRPGPKSRAKTVTSTSENESLANIKNTKASSQKKRDSSDEDSGPGCKELIISEGDVAALRGFVARTRASALARFDADQKYRCALFYAINPLVEIERCPQLERAWSERHHDALPHFAARLGLAPRADVESQSATSSPSRTKRRRIAAQYRERSSSADTNKENQEDKHVSPSKHRSKRKTGKSMTEPAPLGTEPARKTRASGVSERSNKEMVAMKNPTENAETTKLPPKSRASENKEPIAVVKGNARPAVRKVAKESVTERGSKAPRLASDDSDETLANIRAPKESAPPDGARTGSTHVISKRASAFGAKEYSNLEDHAIVAWVSSGSRAIRVNGNRLWKDLEEEYVRLTGISRSWHSLRNRYLRYILPALGALRLPPAHEARLRAAAATGSLKTKHRPGGAPRRNSIFKEPEVASAATRVGKPSAPPSPPPSPTLPPATTKISTNAGPSSARRSLRSNAHEEDNSKTVASRSPRYSDVTRRFAARHRPSPHTSSPSSPSPSPEPAAVRTRKLYNPNKNI